MTSKGLNIGYRLGRLDNLNNNIWERGGDSLHRACRETEHLNTSIKLLGCMRVAGMIAWELYENKSR